MTVISCPTVVDITIVRPDLKFQLGFTIQDGVVCTCIHVYTYMYTVHTHLHVHTCVYIYHMHGCTQGHAHVIDMMHLCTNQYVIHNNWFTHLYVATMCYTV